MESKLVSPEAPVAVSAAKKKTPECAIVRLKFI